MMRVIGGLVGGILLGLVGLLGVSWVNQLLYPALSTVPINDKVRAGEIMLGLPLGAQIIIAAAWFAGALAGGWVAGAISRQGWTVWVIAGLVAVIAVMNVVVISHPLLLQIASVVAPLLGGALAAALVRRTPSAGMGAPA